MLESFSYFFQPPFGDQPAVRWPKTLPRNILPNKYQRWHKQMDDHNKWYILPIGGLYATYHLLGEPETTIDHRVQIIATIICKGHKHITHLGHLKVGPEPIVINGVIPSLKLTARPYKWMVGILLSYWGGLFSGAMLVSGRVTPYKWPKTSNSFHWRQNFTLRP